MELSGQDRQILEMLGDNCRVSNATIAAALGVGQSAVKKRIDRLVDAGVCRLLAVVNPDSLGYRTILFAGLRVEPEQVGTAYAALEAMPEAWYVGQLMGRYDIVVEFLLPDTHAAFATITERVALIAGVTDVETFSALRQTWWRPIEWRPPTDVSVDRHRASPTSWITGGSSTDGPGHRDPGDVDDWDRRIIALLQRNGRMPTAELARELGLSRQAVALRTQRLFTDGICRVTAVLDPVAVGYPADAHVLIRTDPARQVAVADELAELVDVRWIGHITGRFSIYAEILARTTDEALAVVEQKIKPIHGVRQVETSIVVRQTPWLTAEWTPPNGVVRAPQNPVHATG